MTINRAQREALHHHKHDCTNCTFIESVGNTDFYICLNESGRDGSLIKRYSSEGSDYSSYNLADILAKL